MSKSATWFRPGQSGNPRGRPKVDKTLRDLARSCTEDALKALTEVMNDRRAAPLARVVAATAILDRGWGKPESSLTLTPGEQPVQRVHIDLVGGYLPKTAGDGNAVEVQNTHASN